RTPASWPCLPLITSDRAGAPGGPALRAGRDGTAGVSCHRPGRRSGVRGGVARSARSRRKPWAAPPGTCALLLDDGEHVAGGEHQVLLAVVLDLRAAVLAVQHHVADLYVHRHALGTGVVEATRAHRKDLALL